MREEISPAMERQGDSGSVVTQSMEEFEVALARCAKVTAHKLEVLDV